MKLPLSVRSGVASGLPVLGLVGSAVLGSALLGAGLAGCGSATPGARASGPATRGPITLDGSIAEWRRDAVGAADDRFVYLRFAIEGETTTLQSNDETTRILIDADDDPTTGARLRGPAELRAMGVDLEVFITPPLAALPPETQQGILSRARGEVPALVSGVTAVRYGVDGTPRPVGHADIDFAMAPTYASAWTEARIGRLSSALLGSGLDAPGTARAMLVVDDKSREIVGWSDPFAIRLPAPAADLGLADVSIPAQEPGTIRVVSFNVLRARPMREPESFARLISALSPDVILFQEFDGLDSDALEAWLAEHVGPLAGKNDRATRVDASGAVTAANLGTWEAAANPELGVAIATPHRMEAVFREAVMANTPDGEHRVRSISALVLTPSGRALATSVHLKCCGSAGSPEDATRMAEAAAINEFVKSTANLAGSMTGEWTGVRVVGGDLNLVGTRPPVERLVSGLDVDGSDMTIAEPRVLGDNAYYTWAEPSSLFSPGRLDYVLYGDAGASVVNAFVLDLSRLSRDAVNRAGLKVADSAASDHLPLVVDLRPLP